MTRLILSWRMRSLLEVRLEEAEESPGEEDIFAESLTPLMMLGRNFRDGTAVAKVFVLRDCSEMDRFFRRETMPRCG